MKKAILACLVKFDSEKYAQYQLKLLEELALLRFTL
jgi:hypothetical protein